MRQEARGVQHKVAAVREQTVKSVAQPVGRSVRAHQPFGGGTLTNSWFNTTARMGKLPMLVIFGI
jgi:hypothetical protein